jgi:hypothetical protein
MSINKFANFLLITLFTFMLSFPVYSQNNATDTDPSNDVSTLKLDLAKLRNELTAMKQDIDILKKRTEWFDFTIEGSIMVIYGVNIWARFGTPHSAPQFNNNAPITSGFDFKNNLRFKMLLGKKVVASSSETGDYGTEISLSLKIDSVGINNIRPDGSWYMVNAVDDQNNPAKMYFPRFDRNSSNVVFGNIQVVVDEARVKNILGSGFFINYKDVMEVQNYYGVTGISDILTLNHYYFNNGYVMDASGDYGSLYYSYNPEFYPAQSLVSTGMKLWSGGMLYTDLYDNHFTQRPHGMSFGYDKDLADGMRLFIEIGVSSKDAFDPKYFTDEFVDYGFFLKAEPRFYDANFDFNPKLAAGFAFQTDTTNDKATQFSTFAMGFALPFTYNFPNKIDRIKIEFDVDLNVEIAFLKVATLISFTPEFKLANGSFNLSMPVIYSYKNAGRSGFQSVGDPDVRLIDQLYDDHIFNFGLLLGFDSQKLFGTFFQYKATNSIYTAYIQSSDKNSKNKVPGPEVYFFEVLRNELILNDFGIDRLSMFFEFGLGYVYNAKMLFKNTKLKYVYDHAIDSWVDTTGNNKIDWVRWGNILVMSFKTGVDVNIFKNFAVGFSAESPKILINVINPVGNQQSFALFKIYNEIKL